MRMDFDLYEYFLASVDGTLSSLPLPSWKKKSAVCIVLASEGYPESYPKNEEISGLELVKENSFVFHAGTKNQNGKIFHNWW